MCHLIMKDTIEEYKSSDGITECLKGEWISLDNQPTNQPINHFIHNFNWVSEYA